MSSQIQSTDTELSAAKRLFINIVLFQVGWFSCIGFGGVIALFATLGILLAHFYLLVKRQDYSKEIRLIVKVFLVGVVIEIAAINLGALVPLVEEDILAFSQYFPPLWLLCLWLLFATTLSHGLLWMQSRIVLCVVFAAISAPSSYFAGAALSPYMSLGESVIISLSIIGLLWAVAFPLMMRFFVPYSTIHS